MVGWHHRLDGHELEQASGVGDGQGGLACCSPRGRKEPDMTVRLNWTEQGVGQGQFRSPSYKWKTCATPTHIHTPLRPCSSRSQGCWREPLQKLKTPLRRWVVWGRTGLRKQHWSGRRARIPPSPALSQGMPYTKQLRNTVSGSTAATSSCPPPGGHPHWILKYKGMCSLHLPLGPSHLPVRQQLGSLSSSTPS